MKPAGAIERVLRLGAAASLKSEGFAKKGVSFYREFKPGIFHVVRASPQRFSDADTTEVDIVLGATFARLRDVFDQRPFPANPLSVMCDLSVPLNRASSCESPVGGCDAARNAGRRRSLAPNRSCAVGACVSPFSDDRFRAIGLRCLLGNSPGGPVGSCRLGDEDRLLARARSQARGMRRGPNGVGGSGFGCRRSLRGGHSRDGPETGPFVSHSRLDILKP